MPNKQVRALSLAVRKKHKWTQGQLAIHLRVTRRVVENIEQSRYHTAPASIAIALEQLLM